MARFQVKLAGAFQDYDHDEDKVLKRAYMAGFPTAKFRLRGQKYTYDFRRMVQVNMDSQKERAIQQPRNWKQPAKPLVPPGPTTVITVPEGAPGTTIQVPHPRAKGAFISVKVPKSAKAGQAMLVPVPQDVPAAARSAPVKKHVRTASRVSSPPVAAASGGGEWSTGGKVVAGAAGVLGVGGVAVGGVVLGEHIADHGLDATVEAVGDGIEDAAEVTEEFFVDAGEFIVDAGEDVGDFVMDLF
jgi:hypothetical protein